MKDYHTYYFQYTSFIHAMVGIIASNIKNAYIISYRSSYSILGWVQI